MIRPSTAADLDELLRVYAAARRIMQNSGNPTQWGSVRPTQEQIAADCALPCGYLVERDGRICGAFAMLTEPEPTYAHICGAWQSDAPYITLHRVASDGTQRGILHEIVQFAAGQNRSICIDTHRDNRIMRHLLDKEGFVYCGVIRLRDGAPRLAYQRENGRNA